VNPPRFDFQPEPPPEPPRNPFGWVALGLVFVMLIALALYGNALRDQDKKTFAVELQEFRVARATGEAAQASLDRLFEKLPDYSKATGEALLLKAAVDFEGDSKVDPKGIEKLRASKDQTEKALGAFYADPKNAGRGNKALAVLDRTLPLEREIRDQVAVAMGQSTGKGKQLMRQVMVLIPVGATFLLAGIGLLIWFSQQRGQGKLEPKGFPIQFANRAEADKMPWRVVLGLLVLLAPAPEFGGDSAMAVILEVGVKIALALMILLAPIGYPAYGPRDVFGKNQRWGANFAWALGGWAANAVVLLAVLILIVLPLQTITPSAEHPGASEMMSNPTALTVLRFALLAAVTAPLLEEILFRGMLAPAIAKISTPTVAIVISSLLFAAIHPQGIAAWAALGAVGCMCAVLTYYSGSLWPAILLHAFHNGSLVALSLWIQS